MGKSLKFAAMLAAVFGFGAAQANAQGTNSLAQAGPVLQEISAAEVAAMMTEIGVTTQPVRVEGLPEPILLAQTASGARFLFYFFGCDNPATASGCANTVVSTGLPMSGVLYDAINDFNGEANVTVAVSVPSEQLVMFGRNILVSGGHSRDLFQATVYLFLTDVSSFVQKNAGATAVAFSRGREPASKINRATGSQAPAHAFGLDDLSQIVAVAIANTGTVDFSVKDPRAD
ncbi:MAG: hypothetical protein VX640_11235 [Pseudomonadota bacterium]|nr:hypothetical protein [Pseudomonadota bacterium]